MYTGNRGKFSPKYPSKYVGNPYNIVYRSNLELELMRMLDTNINVINWASEELFIKYRHRRKVHKYYPDFIVKIRDNNSELKSYLIEVKPYKFTNKPNPLKENATDKQIARYRLELEQYEKNMSKWKAAMEYCKTRGIEFLILTEDEILNKFR